MIFASAAETLIEECETLVTCVSHTGLPALERITNPEASTQHRY
jgi:hypothetical protein